MPEDLPAPAHTSNPPSMLGLYLAIALLISTVALSGWMGREGTALKVAAAPQGVLSLLQMAKTCGALALHAQAGLPYISVLTHPTTGGVRCQGLRSVRRRTSTYERAWHRRRCSLQAPPHLAEPPDPGRRWAVRRRLGPALRSRMRNTVSGGERGWCRFRV